MTTMRARSRALCRLDAKAIEAARIKVNLTREELAVASGVRYDTIVRIEQGRTLDSHVSTLFAIVEALRKNGICKDGASCTMETYIIRIAAAE